MAVHLAIFLVCFVATSVWCYVIWGQKYLLEKRRVAHHAKPLSSQQLHLLNRAMPLYRRLPPTLQKQLSGHIQVFLAEKHFVGGDGLVVDDNMRLVVAANACLLLLNRHSDNFINVKTIVLYPGAYRAKQQHQHNQIVSDVEQTRLGESWPWGTVVLSWSDSLAGSINEQDGHNVILHEFSHQLDQQNGGATGTPKLKERAMYQQWNKVLSQEYQQLRSQLWQNKSSVIDTYGATNEAEFFAVITESFFERPLQLRKEHSALYEILYRYYQVDPVSWFR
ncbi:zinc-dependent peptidase [Psychrobium sp. 1_MG-2023]|nr:zinc-dependent peptidase [Psychrobium sp. 1_MG-2023]